MSKEFLMYFIAVNLIAFAAFGIDKSKAKRDAYRIPEKTLIGLAVIGGSVGAYAGMKVFHHKTRHKLFTIGIPVIFLLQCGLVILFMTH